jgi:flagellar protein FliS
MTQAHDYAMHYQDMQIKTADQFELVLLLYKAAVKHLTLAKRHIEGARIEQRVGSLNKSCAIIGELQAALDFDNGGEIAVSLSRLYAYMLNRLSVANLNQDLSPIDEVIGLLSQLQSAWEQARIEYNGPQPSGQTQPQDQPTEAPQMAFQ